MGCDITIHYSPLDPYTKNGGFFLKHVVANKKASVSAASTVPSVPQVQYSVLYRKYWLGALGS